MLTFKINNFRGVAQETIVLEHINILVGQNGKGKTSTLSAIAFALTGKAKKDDIRNGEDSASVKIIFPKGETFERVLLSTVRTSQIVSINGKKCKEDVANKFLTKKFGCPPHVLANLLTEDLLNGNVGKMLFDILPLNCSKDIFFNFLTEFKGVSLTNEEKNIVDKFLKENEIDNISFSVIDALYKEMYARRREVNALLKNAKSRSVFDVKRISELAPYEILNEKRDNLLKEKGALQEKEKQLQEYQRLFLAREKALKEKELLEKEYKALSEIKKPDSQAEEKIKNDKMKFNQVILKYQRNKNTLENNNTMLEKVLDNLNKDTCPIHPLIKCTTDKKDFQEEIKKQIAENKKAISDVSAYIKKCEEQIVKRDNMLSEYQKSLLDYQKKVMLNNQLKTFIIPELPEKPVLPEKTNISNEIETLNKDLAVWNEYRIAMKAKEEMKSYTNSYYIYDLLVNAFSPKGIKSIIIHKAITSLKEEVNVMAKNVHPNLEISFTFSNNGLDVLAKFYDKFIPVNVLSSGEKVIVLYLIMELIHLITNANIMAIDNLDRLDKENMKKLFDLLEKSSFSYLIFGSVNHNDTIEVLSGRDIQSIEY